MAAATLSPPWTVPVALRLPIHAGTNVPPRRPIEKTIPKIDPYWLASNFENVTPTIVGKIGANTSPVTTTATVANAAL